MTQRVHKPNGFSLIETVIALAIGTLVAGGIGGVLMQFLTIPNQGIQQLALEQELRTLTAWVRLDANKAQSFKLGLDPVYGTFYWLDFGAYPPTRRDVVYFWDEGILYRQPEVEGIAEAPIRLTANVESYDDVSFVLTERLHAENDDSTLLFLAIAATTTADTSTLDGLTATMNMEMDFRPESIDAARHRFYFLHNAPTPPVGNTAPNALLTMDATVPTATTLFNYDTGGGGDNDAGLTIKTGRKGGDFEEGDANKFQVWTSDVFEATATIDGRASLFFSAGADLFEADRLVVFGAYLYDFDPVTLTETLVIKRAVVGINSTDGWQEASIHFRPTIYTMVPGHQLRLELQVDGDSFRDGMIAYDTTAYQTMLMVPFTPGGLDFTDIAAGGTTAGSIIEAGGLDIEVTDLPNPAGFNLVASGPSRGTGIVNACETAFLLSTGDEISITCGSVSVSVFRGEVEVLLLGGGVIIVGIDQLSFAVSGAELLLPEGSVTRISDITANSFIVSQDAISTTSVTIDVLSADTDTLITAPADSVIKVELLPSTGVVVSQEPESNAPVTVEVGGVVIVIPPGGVLPDGSMGIIEFVIAELEEIRAEDPAIVSAISALTASLNEAWWTDRSTLDPKFGQKVYSRFKVAVQQLMGVLGNGALDPGPEAIVGAGLDDVVEVGRRFAVSTLETSLDTSTTDPRKANRVLNLQIASQDAIDAGDARRDAERWDLAIDDYRTGWERALAALDAQG